MKINHFVIKRDWGLPGAQLSGMVSSTFGWGNGYAALPKGHPCFGMDYNVIMEKYDGFGCELTFSDNGERLPGPPEYAGYDYWIVGFDTAHYGMTIDNYPKEKVEQDAAKLAFRFYEIWLLEQRNLNQNKSD